MTIKVFTLPVCPKCHILMDKMEELGIKFEEVTMTDPEPQTELLMNDIYTITTPVLFVNDKYYVNEKIFDGDRIREDISQLLLSYETFK